MNRIEDLRDLQAEIPKKKLVIGFDGFTDSVARPIRYAATDSTEAKPFETIHDFGAFLMSKAGKSCSVELKMQARQLGGNLPFLSRAAGYLGLDVSCIGMLGENEPEKLFKDMPCTLYPFAASGQAMCLEFHDGKILLSSDCLLPADAWEMVLSATDGRAAQMFSNADLFALVNWSELSFAGELWEHACNSIRQQDKSKFAFFDLCDVSRKSREQIDHVLRMIGGISKMRTAILSLNENEALTIGELFFHNMHDIAGTACAVRQSYGIDEVIVHTIHESLLSTKRGSVCVPTVFVNTPVISTGAGDNFNAASCFAAVMNLEDRERLVFANMYANFYITHGYSPSLTKLMASQGF